MQADPSLKRAVNWFRAQPEPGLNDGRSNKTTASSGCGTPEGCDSPGDRDARHQGSHPGSPVSGGDSLIRTVRHGGPDEVPVAPRRRWCEGGRMKGPVPSSEAVSERMRRQPTRDTAPEIALRRRLHAAGLRFRVDRAPVPGLRRKADIVFTRRRVAVFVDGCFWHGCPAHGTLPASNAEWWEAKLIRNAERDAETNRTLTEARWTVVRVWEHEGLEEAARRVERAVRGAPR